MRVLTYNTWLLPAGWVSRVRPLRRYLAHQQRIRAPLIGAAIPSDVDICVFQEVFDRKAAEALLHAMPHHPHRTAPLRARDKSFGRRLLPGGIVIASRYPILRQAQCIFSAATGLDRFLIKGAVFAEIETPRGRIDIVGTHLQAHKSPAREAVRRHQLRELAAFAAAQRRQENVPLLFVGDMNVRLEDADEVAQMCRRLAATLPVAFAPQWRTYDPKTNPLCEETTPEFLDYVLVANEGPSLPSATATLFQPTAVYGGNGAARPLSDHYGVEVCWED